MLVIQGTSPSFYDTPLERRHPHSDLTSFPKPRFLRYLTYYGIVFLQVEDLIGINVWSLPGSFSHAQHRLRLSSAMDYFKFSFRQMGMSISIFDAWI